MSLIDITSDLSKFRSDFSKEDKSSPEASKATNAKNFATFQPITQIFAPIVPSPNRPEETDVTKLLGTTKRDDIRKPKPVPIQRYLSTTKLDEIKQFKTKPIETNLSRTKKDDIVKKVFQEGLVNSVSNLSEINADFGNSGIGDVPLEKIISQFGQIRNEQIQSRLNSSEIQIQKVNAGTNNLTSNTNLEQTPLTSGLEAYSPEIQINSAELTNNITDPKIEIVPSVLSSDRSTQSPDVNINPNDASDNIENPNVDILSKPLSFDRTSQSPTINVTPNDASDNIQNPNIDIVRSELSFDRTEQSPSIIVNPNDVSDNVQNPDIDIIRPDQTFERSAQSPTIIVNQDDATDNIENPNITIIRPPLFADLEPQSVVINKDLLSPLNNVVNPDIALERRELSFDRTSESPEIITDLPESGLITIPDTKVFRVDLASQMLEDTSIFNIDDEPVRYVQISNLMEMSPSQIVSAVRYDLQSRQLEDNSIYNLDDVEFTDPSGRHENVNESRLSMIGKQEVNFFQNINGIGFTANQQIGDSKLLSNSAYTWNGKGGAAPSVNFMDDDFGIGFRTFARKNITDYIPNSSTFSFSTIPQTDYFDQNGRYTTSGFTTFTAQGETKYKPDSSIFAWYGKRDGAPETDFLDIKKQNTISGFSKLSQLYDSKYVIESSQYDWDGNGTTSPETNFFDITNRYTTLGFSRLSQLFDSKYIPDSSELTWIGSKQTAPAVNYFDIEGLSSNLGFHTFAGQGDSKYIPDASLYDWDGTAQAAPAVNYFDLESQHTNVGFSTFGQLYDSKYIPDSSVYDWDGTKDAAPAVNYFDLSSANSNAGFTTFAAQGDSKYIPDSSVYDWDGAKDTAPAVNYFDLTSTHTNAGFTTFAAQGESKYVPDSSIYDWDGDKQSAPTINYFDLTSAHSNAGFHSFAVQGESKYIPDSSIYDWDGKRSNAPAVNYLDLTSKVSTEGFNTFTQFQISKYIKDSSDFDWDGFRSDAPQVNYLDLTNKVTTAGFTTFIPKLESKYIKDSSDFDWDGSRVNAPAVNYFDLESKYSSTGFHTFSTKLESKYKKDSSDLDWDGLRTNAVNVNYFDRDRRYTTAGFNLFAEKLSTKYKNESSDFDWDGSRNSAPQINYFDLQSKYSSAGFERLVQLLNSKYKKESSNFDWKGTPNTAPEQNYFDKTSKFSKGGFTRLVQKLDSKYVKDSSEFDFNGSKNDAKTTNFFGNTNSPGFTKFPRSLESEYVKDSSKLTFAGSVPKEVNFFPDSFNKGFTLKAQKLVSEYQTDISEFTFKGASSNAPATNYLTNDQSVGFTTFARPLETQYVSDVSSFTWKGARSVASVVDYFPNDNTTGFNSFAPSLETKYTSDSSIFTWKGGRSEAPGVDFIPNDASKGFTALPQTLTSDFVSEYGSLSWKGAKSDAPGVKYFGIAISSPNQVPGGDKGFVPFFADKSNTNLSPNYSALSTETGQNKSTITGIPITNYFGILAGERRGFMPKMNSIAETLYPIIKPELKYNAVSGDRVSIESARGAGGIIVNDREKFAPNSFGKKQSGTGGLLSSLSNQVPDSKVKARPSNYGNPYERNMKNVTNSVGYLTTWATKGMFSSELDKQYDKYNLQNNSYNLDRELQPYETRDIGQRWSMRSVVDDGTVRGGSSTLQERIDRDIDRIEKFLRSTKGTTFTEKQKQLQLMNPAVDADVDSLSGNGDSVINSTTQIYNPGSIIENIRGASNGVRISRHSLTGGSDETSLNRYESTTIKREYSAFPDATSDFWRTLTTPSSSGDQTNYNRLIGLMKEMLPESFKPISGSSPTISQNVVINRLSTQNGGVHSPLGLGPTTIRKSRHPHLTFYSTSPVLPESNLTFGSNPPDSGNTGQTAPDGGPSNAVQTSTYDAPPWSITSEKNPRYPITSRRNQYYSTLNAEGDKPNYYSNEIINDYVSSDKKIFGSLRKLSEILDDAPFEINTTRSSTLPSKINLQDTTLQKIKQLDPYDPKRKTIADRVRRTDFINAGVANEADTETISTSSPNETDPLKKYLSATYSNLRKATSGDPNRSRKFNDFRFDLYAQDQGQTRTVTNADGTTSTVQNNEAAKKEYIMSDPSFAKYHALNLERYFGFGSAGEPGSQRNLPFVSNVTYAKSTKTGATSPQLKNGRQFRGDRINILDYRKVTKNINKNLVYEKGKYNNDSIPGTEDLIEFYFTGLKIQAGGVNRPAEIIAFRATFDSITDNHSPKWNPIKYMGRGDPLYVYDGYERSISFGFTVHIGSRDEMKASWRKLNHLASWTAPEYTKGGLIRGPIIRLNIGHLYRKMPGFISSLSYTFDNAGTTWETAHLSEDKKLNVVADNVPLSTPGALQLPKHIQVGLSFTPIGVYRPEYNGVMYSLYDDTGADIETGLIPQSDKRVNYFRAIDGKSASDPENVELYNSPSPNSEDKIPVPDEKLREDTQANVSTDPNPPATSTSSSPTGTGQGSAAPTSNPAATPQQQRPTPLMMQGATPAATGTTTPDVSSNNLLKGVGLTPPAKTDGGFRVVGGAPPATETKPNVPAPGTNPPTSADWASWASQPLQTPPTGSGNPNATATNGGTANVGATPKRAKKKRR
jgi:hypothetical protein